MKTQWIIAGLLMMFSGLALAHPGHGLMNAAAGFMHPLTGWDHLLVMLAIGVWAGRLGGEARWKLPVTFLAVMLLGALIGEHGFSGVETAIALSVMAMGLLLILNMPVSVKFQMMVTAAFALMHGFAHGSELQGVPSLLGMLMATALLHLLGLFIGLLHGRFNQYLYQILAWGMMFIGGYALIPV